jgi:hypothetical protein
MAEPSLPAPPPSRPASEIDYKPLSWLAVAAIAVAGAYLVFVLVTGGAALWYKKPTLNIFPLFLAGTGLVLAVVARAQIRRSEGTRDGRRMAGAAWWISVLGGAAYGAYLYASILALRQQSDKVALEWLDLLKQGKTDQAFLYVIDPASRQNVNPENRFELEGRFGGGLLPTFRSSELVRFYHRNGADVEVTPLGMSGWQQVEGGYQVESAFKLRAPEGSFTLNIMLIGSEGPNVAGREWHIRFSDQSLVTNSRTTYGRLLLELLGEAGGVSQAWLESLSRKMPAVAYIDTLPAAERGRYRALLDAKMAGLVPYVPMEQLVRAALPLAKQEQGADDPLAAALVDRGLFQVEGAKFVTEETKAKLRGVWSLGDIAPAGKRRLQNPETGPQLTFDGKQVTFVLPVEVGLPGSPVGYAAGRLVLVSDTPELVKELKELKEQGKADPDRADTTQDELLRSRPSRNWRVERIETTLEPLQMQQRSGPPGGGGPGGPGG